MASLLSSLYNVFSRNGVIVFISLLEKMLKLQQYRLTFINIKENEHLLVMNQTMSRWRTRSAELDLDSNDI